MIIGIDIERLVIVLIQISRDSCPQRFFYSLRTLINERPADCLLDSGASHNFLASSQCKEKGLKVKGGNQFSVRLADGQEIPAVGKVHCLIDLEPMKTAITFYVYDCNVPCVLGIPFLQTTNPTINWVTRSIQVYTVSDLSPLEVVNNETIP